MRRKQKIMQKTLPYIQLYLRLAMGIGFIVPGLDRLGAWGSYGQKGISWGDWQHFMQYAADVMRFLPYSAAQVFAIIATVAEIAFGAMLILGLFTKTAAIGSGVLTLCFGTAMAKTQGIVSPLSYSVFVVSGAGFLLAFVKYYKYSLDNLLFARNKTSTAKTMATRL